MPPGVRNPSQGSSRASAGRGRARRQQAAGSGNGQRYVKSTAIDTVTAMMLPYSVTFITIWTVFLLLYWAVGIPLGLQSSYMYAP